MTNPAIFTESTDDQEDAPPSRFDAFKAALANLCFDHRVGLRTEGAVFVIDGRRSDGVLIHGTDFRDATRGENEIDH